MPPYVKQAVSSVEYSIERREWALMLVCGHVTWRRSAKQPTVKHINCPRCGTGAS